MAGYKLFRSIFPIIYFWTRCREKSVLILLSQSTLYFIVLVVFEANSLISSGIYANVWIICFSPCQSFGGEH